MILCLHSFVSDFPDERRAQGRRFTLPAVLTGALLGIVSGALWYRKLHCFFAAHLEAFNALFGVCWRKAASYTGLRRILHGLDAEALERAMREHARRMREARSVEAGETAPVIAFDGKVLRGSFDHFEDQKAAQILRACPRSPNAAGLLGQALSAFAVDGALTLGCLQIEEKSNEIPAVQRLLEELNLSGCLVAVDATHCQKNIRGGAGRRREPDRASQSLSEKSSRSALRRFFTLICVAFRPK